MKKKVFNKKLKLNKETIVSFSDSQLNNVKGGGTQRCTDEGGPNCPAVTIDHYTCDGCLSDLCYSALCDSNYC